MNELINRIHHQDCMSILSKIPNDSIDMVLTDPPYMNTNLVYDELAKKSLNLKSWFEEIVRVAKPNAVILIFASGKFTYEMVNIGNLYFRYELIWDKVKKITGHLNANLRPLLNHEFILYFSKTFNRNSKGKKANTYNHGVVVDKSKMRLGNVKQPIYNNDRIEYKKLNNKLHPRSILKYNKPNLNTFIHPSEKPIGLIEELLLMYSNENDVVLDTFSGSGVVAHASIVNGRSFIACELNEEFYNLSIQRIKNCIFSASIIEDKHIPLI